MILTAACILVVLSGFVGVVFLGMPVVKGTWEGSTLYGWIAASAFWIAGLGAIGLKYANHFMHTGEHLGDFISNYMSRSEVFCIAAIFMTWTMWRTRARVEESPIDKESA